MSWQATRWARGRAPSSGAQLALFGLADRADPHGITYCSQRDLADGCRAGERTIRRNLAELEGCGLIARIARRDGRGHALSDYTVLAPNATDRGELTDVPDELIDTRYPADVAELARAFAAVVPPANLAGKDPHPAKLAAGDGSPPARFDRPNRPDSTVPTGQFGRRTVKEGKDKEKAREQTRAAPRFRRRCGIAGGCT